MFVTKITGWARARLLFCLTPYSELQIIRPSYPPSLYRLFLPLRFWPGQPYSALKATTEALQGV